VSKKAQFFETPFEGAFTLRYRERDEINPSFARKAPGNA
jgi:hypothetical protein